MVNENRVRFGLIEGARRVWAVGAIHGECEKLAALHGKIETRFETGDRLVYLGNFLGRGPAIIETVDEILMFRRALMARFSLFENDIVFLRGSQEEMWQKLTQIQIAQDPAQILEWVLAEGVGATMQAYGLSADVARMRCREGPLALARWSLVLRESVRAHAGHEALLASVRRAALTETGNILLVHAGVDTARPLSAQADSFWWGAGRFDDIAEPYEGFVRIVRGHDADHGGITVGSVAATIDAGCGHGGNLAAACLDSSGDIIEVIEV